MTPPGTPGWVATTVAPWPWGALDEQDVNVSTVTSAGTINKQANVFLFMVGFPLVADNQRLSFS
jgi:hypothetical protein